MDRLTSADALRARFPLHFEHEVEFREIDLLRHVNNVRYTEWAETMRSLYFDDVFRFSFFDDQSVIIARHDLHYDAPTAYRERILIGGGVERWGTKSFDFVTVAFSLTASRQVFHAVATLVAYDYRANASIPIPDVWRERVAALTPSTL